MQFRGLEQLTCIYNTDSDGRSFKGMHSIRRLIFNLLLGPMNNRVLRQNSVPNNILFEKNPPVKYKYHEYDQNCALIVIQFEWHSGWQRGNVSNLAECSLLA